MKLLTWYLLFLVHFPTMFSLSGPKSISEIELEQITNTIAYEMEWTGRDGLGIAFSYKDGLTTMKTTNKESFKNRCISTLVWLWQTIYRYFNSNCIPSFLAEPLEVMGNPHLCSIEQIVPFLFDKKVIIYTGAGISAGVVPTMSELLNSFSLRSKEDMVSASVMDKLICNPEQSIVVMEKFYHSCLYGMPTDAHRAVARISLAKGWPVITENLDLLHERSGIAPIKRTQFKSDISVADLKNSDVILVIGLASDESGLLACYKQNKPDGIIIAINLSKPEYLADKDFLILQDAQIALPALSGFLI